MTVLSSLHPKYRTKLCRYIANGSCPYGQKCSFFHPPAPIHPFLSSLAQYLMSWNPLLPQYLPMPNGQAPVHQIQRQRQPSGYQIPELVDENPSSDSSLLFSVSDSTSSRRGSGTELLPPFSSFFGQPRDSDTYPEDEQYMLQQDVTALPFEDADEEQVSPSESTDDLMDQVISGGVLMSMPSQPPPVTGQPYVDSSEQIEPEQVQLAPLLQQDALYAAIRSDFTGQLPPYGSGYTLQPYASYYPTIPGPATNAMPPSPPVSFADEGVYQSVQAAAYDPAPPAPYHDYTTISRRHSMPVSVPISVMDYNVHQSTQTTLPNDVVPPAPYHAIVSARSTVPVPAPVSTGDRNVYWPVQIPGHNNVRPPIETESAYSAGMHQTHDAPHFLAQASSIPVFYSIPVPATPYASMVPMCPCHRAPPLLPSSSYSSFSNPTRNVSLPPLLPDLASQHASASSAPSGSVFSGSMGSTHVADQLQIPTQVQPEIPPFPYDPPRNQQVGHARRVSVIVKKRARGYSG